MTPKLRIVVDGDRVEISGRREVVAAAVDTSLLNYVEVDGCIVTTLCDPVEHAGRQAANAAVNRLRIRNGLQDLRNGFAFCQV